MKYKILSNPVRINKDSFTGRTCSVCKIYESYLINIEEAMKEDRYICGACLTRAIEILNKSLIEGIKKERLN